MTQAVVYENADSSIGIVYPTTEGLTALGSIQALAERDVPTGLPFKIVDIVDIPTDRTFRDAWEWDVDLTDPANNDGVGA